MTQKDKELLLKAIEQKRQEVRPTNTGEMKPATVPNNLELGWLNALTWMEKFINSLSSEQLSKEDLEEASQEHVKKLYGENWMDFVYTQEAAFRAELSFKSGANWRKEQLINKASKWLADNVIHYIWKSSKGEIGISDDFFIDFEKAMEE